MPSALGGCAANGNAVLLVDEDDCSLSGLLALQEFLERRAAAGGLRQVVHLDFRQRVGETPIDKAEPIVLFGQPLERLLESGRQVRFARFFRRRDGVADNLRRRAEQ